MKYKVLDVINRASGETADKFGVIGTVLVPVISLLAGRSAIFSHPDGKTLRTSDVEGIIEVGDVVEVTTLNTIYVLQPVIAKSVDTGGMTYNMSRLAYNHLSKGWPQMSDTEILAYLSRGMGLRGTFTKLQVN